jgi:hypothetical protein
MGVGVKKRAGQVQQEGVHLLQETDVGWKTQAIEAVPRVKSVVI